MSNALLTGASGLIAHQRLLDVVGHNIANVNTTGYKAQRATFTDHFYETLSPATNPDLAGRGGTNPTQIGQGVRLSQIDRNFDAGALEDTGGQFDVAIVGEGFFVVSDGTNDFYTRAGKFSIDTNGVLVAQGGLEVQRLPFVGEPDGTNIGFQVPGNSQIRIPHNRLIPGNPSSEITITGNLSNSVASPTPTVRMTITPLRGPSGVADESTLINDLDVNREPYQAGDKIFIEGDDVGGKAIEPTVFDVTDTSTLGDLITAINSAATGFQASLVQGNIVLTATETGPTSFKLKLREGPDNVGAMSHSLDRFSEPVKGTNEGIVQLSSQVIDPRGTEHPIDLVFERTTKNTWRLTASISPSDGIVENNIIEPIEFNDDGTLRSTGDQFISLNLNGFDELQSLRVSFDDPDNLAQSSNQGDLATATATADGDLPGTLTKAVIDEDGRVIGIDSNGRQVTIAQLAMANFRNNKGLEGVRDSLFVSSLNSGEPEIGVAGSSRRGAIRSGQLESSNVDVAFEFTRLIVAQRGFSANARTITVTDEVLEELTNIVR